MVEDPLLGELLQRLPVSMLVEEGGRVVSTAGDAERLMRLLPPTQGFVEGPSELQRTRDDGSTEVYRVTRFAVGNRRITLFHDITGERLAEREAAQQRADGQLILDSVPAFIWCKDSTNRILRCNRAAAESAGTTVARMEGHPTVEFYPDEAGKYWADDLEVIRSGQPKLGIIEPYQLGNGEKVWVRTDKLPYWDSSGALVGVMVFSIDISVIKHAEEERAALLEHEQKARADAEQANQMKDSFLATTSHELRTPLTAILGWAQLLRGGSVPSADFARAVNAIERNAAVQVQMIEELLDVSRVVSGRMRLQPSPIDLRAVITDAVETLRPAAEARGLTLELELEGPIAMVGDQNRLRQVACNLLSNANKFTPRGGRISVKLARTDEGVRLRVRDTGRGMSREFLPRAFERFVQEDLRASRQNGGLGIGLAVVRHIVELHGGRVSASSAGPGRGSEFTVELPIASAELGAAKAPLARSKPDALRGVRVLLVEDHADTRDLLSAVLSAHEALVTPVGSVDEALGVLASQRSDILISDIGLPIRDGFDLIRAVREHDQVLPALALTAYAGAADRARILGAGFQGHVSKPVDVEQLVAAIERLVSEPRHEVR